MTCEEFDRFSKRAEAQGRLVQCEEYPSLHVPAGPADFLGVAIMALRSAGEGIPDEEFLVVNRISDELLKIYNTYLDCDEREEL